MLFPVGGVTADAYADGPAVALSFVQFADISAGEVAERHASRVIAAAPTGARSVERSVRVADDTVAVGGIEERSK